MSKDDKPTKLEPRLRFPEFKGDPGWDTPAMSKLYGFRSTNSLSRDQLNYDSGSIYNIHYGDIHTKFQTLFRLDSERVPYIDPAAAEELGDRFHLCREGDIILADASEDLNDVGKAIELISIGDQRVVAGTHTIHASRLSDKPAIGFGGYLFKSAAVRRGIHKEAQGAKVYGISSSRIASVRLPLPHTTAEQRKIAECLGSLDDWIAAETEALAALRRHKTGLMQQLFPRPGETQPRLRFPEFLNAKEWKERSIGKLCDVLNNRRVPVTTADRTPGPFPYYGASGIVDYVDDFIFDEPLVLVGEDGAKWAAGDPTAFIAEGKYWVNNHAHVLKPRGIIDGLLVAFLTFTDIGGYVTGAAPPKLTLAGLKRIPIPVPPTEAEQRRIAGCLASLDATIAAQVERLDALRTHKRGLMQQLFPAPDLQPGEAP